MTHDPPAMLEVKEVHFGFTSRPDFLGPITLPVASGELWAIVGPNGAGKSTLLRLMAGLYRPHKGSVSLMGKPLSEMSGRDRARRVSFVPQNPPVDLDLTARDVVLLGRFPHRSMGLFESAADNRIAERAMEITETDQFADRPINTLSGGEAQRVHVAAAFAQEPKLLLLDEPTASLDIQHQIAIFEILRERTRADGLAVVVVTHDVNLASDYCSRILLLCDGRSRAIGPPAEVLTPETLGPVYGVELAAMSIPGAPDRSWVVPISSTGEARP